MSDPHDIMQRASDVLERAAANRLAGGRNNARGRRKVNEVGRRLTRIAGANGLILLAAIVVGLAIGPLGLLGAVGVMALMLLATLALAMAPTAPPPSPDKLRQAPLAALPAQTERWLEAQRPALPAPAVPVLDAIAIRLDTLKPQLAGLNDAAPAAAELRKLVSEQLPEFVGDYQKVPANLRNVPRNGKTPDAQLIDGLKLIEREIGEMTAELAQGDLDSLATRGRFLEIKYRGDEGAA
ncbi:MAG: hypothetical protein H2054_10160 [Sphingomonas sp.]|uniref:hypothetical protein n=1 Tax=Sphingomonas sp. TaxID=28214 RepID=UPI000DB5F007|nr:hypothetical protein [Zymomonas sp.]MBA4773455.1 hypothetical protein [Sphingomonas sp.]PZP19573.1 MAG: hypothetical protein DI607_02060 [Sphingomonas hengshuiensis]